MSRLPITRATRRPVLLLVVAVALVAGCGDDDGGITIDQAAEVDDGASGVSDAGAAGVFGAADVSFDGVTASISGATCTNDGRLVVTPIVSDSFTLTVDGDPQADEWNLQITQPGEPPVVWTAIDPLVDVDGDVLAGSAQMQRSDDPTITAPLAFVVDC